MTARKLIWFPRPGNNKGTFWGVLFIFVVIGTLGMMTMPALKGFADLEASDAKYISWSAILFLANVWLVYQRACPNYLHPDSARFPSFVTVLVLSALLSLVIAVIHGPATEQNGWLKILFTAEGMLTGLLFVTSLWNADEPNLQEIGSSVRRIAELRKQAEQGVFEPNGNGADEAWQDLVEHLDRICEGAAEARMFYDADPNTKADFQNLGKVARHFRNYLDGKSSTLLRQHEFINDYGLKAAWDEFAENTVVRRGT